jgi:hypothetical protein
MCKVWLVRGTIQRHDGGHVRLYIHAGTAGDLVKYVGRTVVAVLVLVERE